MSPVLGHQRRRAARHTEESDILLQAEVEMLGIASRGQRQTRGRGLLTLCSDELVFALFGLDRVWRRPLSEIVDVGLTRRHIGQSAGRREDDYLRVAWRTDAGADSIAFRVEDPAGWRKAVNDERLERLGRPVYEEDYEVEEEAPRKMGRLARRRAAKAAAAAAEYQRKTKDEVGRPVQRPVVLDVAERVVVEDDEFDLDEVPTAAEPAELAERWAESAEPAEPESDAVESEAVEREPVVVEPEPEVVEPEPRAAEPEIVPPAPPTPTGRFRRRTKPAPQPAEPAAQSTDDEAEAPEPVAAGAAKKKTPAVSKKKQQRRKRRGH